MKTTNQRYEHEKPEEALFCNSVEKVIWNTNVGYGLFT